VPPKKVARRALGGSIVWIFLAMYKVASLKLVGLTERRRAKRRLAGTKVDRR
jgi:hypothetical protein